MTTTALEVERLTAGYGLTSILEGMTFKVLAGARLAILGRNGVGKTTLLATLAGHTTRIDGTIRLYDTDLADLEPYRRARAGLGYVPQARCVFPSLTVEENLYVGLKSRNRSAIEEAYAIFPRLKERRRNFGSQLSGGEQQMLATARTLLGRPTVLLLDEPLEGLAPTICEELMAGLSRLAFGGDMTILLVEQRIQSALTFATHALIMERGQIAWSGTPAELKEAPHLVERLLGVAGDE